MKVGSITQLTTFSQIKDDIDSLMKYKKYAITPVPKPRMTKSDAWKKRPSVLRYWAFKDAVQLAKFKLPKRGAHVVFCLPMPKSWSKKKKEQMNGKAHEQTPDLDNLIKALGDSVYQNDSGISDIRASKIWGNEGAIFIFES